MPGTLEALTVLLVFVVPGYIAASVFTRSSSRSSMSDLQFVFQVAVWSALIYLFELVASNVAGRSASLLQIVENIKRFYAGSSVAEVLSDATALLIYPAIFGLIWRVAVDKTPHDVLRSVGLTRHARADRLGLRLC